MNFDNLDYSTYVGLVKETNRPSGGIKTVQSMCVNAFINSKKRVLEIGCNTGFTSLNIARLTGSEVIGVDLVQESITESKRRAVEEGLKNVDFVKASATNLPFEDKSFDIVWLSNVLSFIDDKYKAMSECLRVLKPNGFLIFVPIYYISTPPKDIFNEVEKAINSKISIRSKKSWLSFIKSIPTPTEVIFSEDFRYEDVESNIENYIEEVFSKKELKKMNYNDHNLLKKKGLFFMKLFNNNLKYCGYTTFIVQKRENSEESELYSSFKSNQ